MADETKRHEIKRANILSVKDAGSFKGNQGKDVQMWEIVVQNADNVSEVFTGISYRDQLPENVKIGEVTQVENVDVVVTQKGDKVSTKIYFADQKKDGGKSSGTQYKGRYGSSPEELSLRKYEAVLKEVGVGYRFAFDKCISDPEITVEGICDYGDQVVDRMFEKAKQRWQQSSSTGSGTE